MEENELNPLRSIAKDLCRQIPTDPAANVEWRLDFYKRMSENTDERRDFKSLCRAYYPLVFKALFFTFNPRNKPGYRNIPFITWESQDDTIEAIVKSIQNGGSLVIDKSRDEGATWLMLGTFFCMMLFENDCNFLVGSRKEEFVDKTGDHKTLFAKLVYLHDKLPIWAQPKVEKMHMHFKVLSTNSVCDGEATNENFGAGDRRTAIGLDEFGRVDANIAENIKDTISDVTDCVVYNSTHFYGRMHPYAKVLYGGIADISILSWEDNPIKSQGMYSSPDLNIIKIHDINYWRKRHYLVFDDLEKDVEYKASDLERWALERRYKPYPFIADGNAVQLRSPWFDKQERVRSPKDLAMNVNRDPLGSSGAFFDLKVLHRAITDARDPDHEGEVLYEITSKGERDKISNVEWKPKSGRKRLKWWGTLPGSRPNQGHNYVIGCDISLGSGSSHSVASILDANTNTKVGRWACAFTDPRAFAEQVVALCDWIGGQKKPFLIWESNGGQGHVFEMRVKALGYSFVYYKTDERVSYRPTNAKKGWHSSKATKSDLLSTYRDALHCRYTTKNKGFINYDLLSLRQCEDYVFLDAGGSIGPSCFREADDGAVATHGDMVIADALCWLGKQNQSIAEEKKEDKVVKGSLAFRDMIAAHNKKIAEESHWLN